MGAKAEDLANRFEQTNNQAIKAIEGIPDAKWKANCQSESWPVNVTAHHIASSHEPVAGIVGAIANGQPLPPLTPQMLDAGNAQHAQQFAGASKQETLEAMRKGGEAATKLVRGLSDEQLGRSAQLFGNEMTAQGAIENILIGHVEQHLQSIQAAQ